MGLLNFLFGNKANSKTRKLPNGWTETKILPEASIIKIPLEQLERWKVAKWNKDKVSSFLKSDGFYIKTEFRSGTIYFVEKAKVCEIYFELSGVTQFDILVFFDDLVEWFLPSKIKMSEIEIKEIKKKLIIWLKKEKIRSDL
jgi:hypothetical protein